MAETALRKLASESELEVVIVRPPLVFGPNARGNLALLMKLLAYRIPLPLGAIDNQRSLIGLENLANFLAICSEHPKAAGQTFNVSDGESVSTPQMLRILGSAMDRKALLVPIPVNVLKFLTGMLKADSYYERLSSNLEVDSTNCQDQLNWTPPLSVEKSIASLI